MIFKFFDYPKFNQVREHHFWLKSKSPKPHSFLLRAQGFLLLTKQLPKNTVLGTPSALPEKPTQAISMIHPCLSPIQEIAKPQLYC